jgi:hypothetical protein
MLLFFVTLILLLIPLLSLIQSLSFRKCSSFEQEQQGLQK